MIKSEFWTAQVRCRRDGAIGVFDALHTCTVPGATRDDVVNAALASCRAAGFEPSHVEGWWPWVPLVPSPADCADLDAERAGIQSLAGRI